MSCQENQCSALSFNRRCTNLVIKSSNHCEIHYNTAMKLYKNYKQICDVAYNLDLYKEMTNTESHIKYILKCYVWLNKAYYARMKHRQYAFVPECYDEGHDKQFEIIKEKINTCEDILSGLYIKYNEKNTSQKNNRQKNASKTNITYSIINEDTTDSPDNNQDDDILDDSPKDDKIYDDISIKDIPKKVRKLYKKRKTIKTDIDDYLNKYIEENKIILERRDKLQFLIINFISTLYGPELIIDEDNAFTICVATHHLVRELYSVYYFDDDFKAEKCKDCKCNNYVTYDVKLGCGCMRNHNTVKKYMNLMSEPALKHYFELLLKNKEKIRPLIKDIIWHHMIYDSQILFLDWYFTWNDDKQRLVLEQSTLPPLQKQSKFLAQFRLKKKYLLKKLENEKDYDSTDSDDD